MKHLLSASLYVIAVLPTVHAAEMVAVEVTEKGFLRVIEYGGVCKEWKFVRNSKIRFVACGYEDGTTFTFFRRNIFGGYKPLFNIYPICQSQKNIYRWLDASAIVDVAPGPNLHTINLQATFAHKEMDFGESERNALQKRIPLVLFAGECDESNPQVTHIELKQYSLEQAKKLSNREK